MNVHAYEDGPPGASPVVFLHGAGMDHTVWRYQTRWLGHRGRRVVAPDFPGHGASDGEPCRSVEEWGEWLVSFLSARVGEAATLVGHSMGGLVAVEVAAQHPDLVGGLILVGTGPRMVPHPALMAAARDDLAEAARFIGGWSLPSGHRGSHPDPGVWERGAIEALLRRSRSGVLAADLASCAAYDAAASAVWITCPSTVVSGSADRMAPFRAAAELSRLIPDADLVVMEGMGHEPMLQGPRLFNRLLDDNLMSYGKPSTR